MWTAKIWDQVVIDGYTFEVEVFFEDHRINEIQLIPVNIEMKDPGYPDKKYQEEKKKAADSFLRAKLGSPLKESEAVLYYEFDWGTVSSVAFLSGRNEYAGGFITISYNKEASDMITDSFPACGGDATADEVADICGLLFPHLRG